MIETRWLLRQTPRDETENLSAQFGLPNQIAAVLFNRSQGEDPDTFLRKSLKDLKNPSGLIGAEKAAERLAVAVQNNEKILVHGDFDADGITSCALVYNFLRDIGARVAHYIPNRLSNNHGLSEASLDAAKEQSAHLLITTDCGSSDKAAIEKIQAEGIDVIITDHHIPGDTQHAACVFVNPHLAGSDPQWNDATGVGVAFAVIMLLRKQLRHRGFFDQTIEEPNLKAYLDIVALGTVADMAKLKGQNRIIVHQGLQTLRVSKRPGIHALREQVGQEYLSTASVYDLGFRFAPRINAAARLGKADDALHLLTADDAETCADLASKLEAYNADRKNMQTDMFQHAWSLAKMFVERKYKCIVVGDASFHTGIIGLVAQKLSQQFHRPVFVYGPEGKDAWRMSGRSRGGVDLSSLLGACSDALVSYGGHAAAGGCVLKKESLTQFISLANAFLKPHTLLDHHLQYIDAKLPLSEVTTYFYDQLETLGPFGIGNPEPIFISKATVLKKECLKERHLRLLLQGKKDEVFSAIAFDAWERLGPLSQGEVCVVYRIDRNHWRGRSSLQLKLVDILTEFPQYDGL